ncbi:MAG: chalcone isomerase family protein [Gammaproteobacteria bacterium]|jgi:hypothetical protein
MKKRFVILIIGLLFLAAPALAEEVEGVMVPETVVRKDGAILFLNGAGLRTKFFFKIYVGSLYLTSSTHEIDKVLNDPGPKRVGMHILYKELEKEKITDGWTEGFKDNNTSEQLASLQARLDKFNSLFPDLKEGDEVYMDYVPDKGTKLVINEKPLGTIEGQDFNIALLKVWLGDSPADSDLKSAMMGN